VSRWLDWHDAYDDPDSPLTHRLAIVRRYIADALDAAPPGPIRVISMCPGDARDLLGVLERQPRGRDVMGRLVELDPELAARARSAAPEGIEISCADASTTSAYEGAVPADLVLVCGVFGNIGDNDIAYDAPDGFLFGVGTHRLASQPTPFEPRVEMFTFVGYDALDGRDSRPKGAS
jgi:hypothetical protein